MADLQRQLNIDNSQGERVGSPSAGSERTSMWAQAAEGLGGRLLQRKLARRLAASRGTSGSGDGGATAPATDGGGPAARPTGAVAKLGLHADTETADRTKLTIAELRNAQVGHSWISLRYLDPKAVPEGVSSPTKRLLQHGGTSLGFWPLIHRASQWPGGKPNMGIAERLERGETPGAGASADPRHRGFKQNPFDSWVPGRVEEPDNAHAPKGTQTYDLDQTQVDSLLRYVDSKRDAQYSLYRYNCTTFAVDAVSASGHSAPAASTMGICLPNALYRDILEAKYDGDGGATTTPLEDGEREPASPSKR